MGNTESKGIDVIDTFFRLGIQMGYRNVLKNCVMPPMHREYLKQLIESTGNPRDLLERNHSIDNPDDCLYFYAYDYLHNNITMYQDTGLWGSDLENDEEK